MAVDTAAKRCSALTTYLPFRFGNVPSGTVSRPDALWAYSGITYISSVPTHTVSVYVYSPARTANVESGTRTHNIYSGRKTHDGSD